MIRLFQSNMMAPQSELQEYRNSKVYRQQAPSYKAWHRGKESRNVRVTVTQLIEADPETAQMVEFIHNNIKAITITMFHVSKKWGRRLNMLSRDKS